MYVMFPVFTSNIINAISGSSDKRFDYRISSRSVTYEFPGPHQFALAWSWN